MADIKTFLQTAQQRGIVSEETAGNLEALWKEQSGEVQGTRQTGIFAELDRPRDADDAQSDGSGETPRFIRGFHDILITIGIVAAVSGLWALTMPIVVIAAVIIFSEIFIKRQRLALPAFTLTIVMTIAVSFSMAPLMQDHSPSQPVIFFVGQMVALAIYYWRYRVPIALAGLICAGFFLAFTLVMLIADGGIASGFASKYPRIVALIGLALTSGMFAIALYFDMIDRERRTRRSDVAFWLHLAAAPLLLISSLMLLIGGSGSLGNGSSKQGSDIDGTIAASGSVSAMTLGEAFITIGVVAVMALIGVVIDRRAFITSGLISLGVALYIVIANTRIGIPDITAFVLLAVGVIVLLLGTGWKPLRRLIVGALPATVQSRVPPIAV